VDSSLESVFDVTPSLIDSRIKHTLFPHLCSPTAFGPVGGFAHPGGEGLEDQLKLLNWLSSFASQAIMSE
jgi:hypothetical protein